PARHPPRAAHEVRRPGAPQPGRRRPGRDAWEVGGYGRGRGARTAAEVDRRLPAIRAAPRSRRPLPKAVSPVVAVPVRGRVPVVGTAWAPVRDGACGVRAAPGPVGVGGVGGVPPASGSVGPGVGVGPGATSWPAGRVIVKLIGALRSTPPLSVPPSSTAVTVTVAVPV